VENLSITAELTIIYLSNPSLDVIESVLASWSSLSLLKYVLLHPFKIKKDQLLPKVTPLLSSLVPPQTYLEFGSETLHLDKDINCEDAVLIVEHDQDYMRIDEF
jgi:hypothetical protein